MNRQKILAAKIALVVSFSLGGISLPSQAGIPVIDGGNLAQNVMTAMESVAQTLKQVEQYQTQLQQYENQLQNTLAPAAHIWDQATRTMDNLRVAINTLDYYQQQLGSLDAYLGKFQDVAYYRSSPCFNGTGGCSKAEWTAMDTNRQLANESQKRANDDLFHALKHQQDALQTDARSLERLQSAAQGADGQLQALGYANQLASQQANQLLQMRSMLVAQQQVVAVQMQAAADLDAKHQAAHAASTQPRIESTPKPKNWLELAR